MRDVILLRYGEIHLKGKNRNIFENALLRNIKSAIFAVDENAQITKIGGRYLVSEFNEQNLNILKEKLTKIFGLVSLSVAKEVDSDVCTVKAACLTLLQNNFKFSCCKTFKVDVKRAD